nr:hypothetical protein [Tanacetum cinerariifolium]
MKSLMADRLGLITSSTSFGPGRCIQIELGLLWAGLGLAGPANRMLDDGYTLGSKMGLLGLESWVQWTRVINKRSRSLTSQEHLVAMEEVGYYEWNGSKILGTPRNVITLNIKRPYPLPDVEVDYPETATF